MFSPDVDPKRRLSTRIGKDRYEEICRVYFIEAVGLELVKTRR